MSKKQDSFYFENFKSCTEHACRAAHLLDETMRRFDPDSMEQCIEEMHRIEHGADEKKHEILNVLAKAFITPIDREDILLLSQSIDDMVDKIEDVLLRIYCNNVQSIRPEALAVMDVIVRCCEEVQRLIEEDLLQKLDKSKLDCLDKLSDAVKGLPYDPDNDYSIPYFWGTVGVVYDKTKVDIEDLEREGYNIFLDEKYKGDIYLYDSERDSFMMALKALGYSMNTENEDELQEAYDWLVQCVQTMEPEIVTDEIIDNMAQGRKALGLIYSGDATYVMSENENMGYYMPETGTNLWSDAMVIPKNARNVELAHAFINYATDYDGAYDNSSYVGYTSANQEVIDVLSGEGGDYEGINAYIPRSGNPDDEVFTYNEETRKIIGDLWSRVKIAASNAD